MAESFKCSIARRLSAVAERVGHMDPAHTFAAGEVGDRASDAQASVLLRKRGVLMP
ncbi:hypothetical protein [Allosphingosinicella sp.]|uniref:hypothetical protein n=1 Tax=Allosphingosinicella sp. TaxID=2823234 RepID=UPI003D74168C